MIQRMMGYGFVTACLGLTLALSVSAGDKGGKDGKTDAEFVMKASETDLAEIGLGTLALSNAGSDMVKKFGQKMIEDHGISIKKLIPLALKNGYKVAMGLNEEHKAKLDKLAGLKGADFDQMYLKEMVMGHKKALALYQHQAKHGKDEDVRAFAKKGVPIVEMHLKMAMEMASAKEDSDKK